MLHKYLSHATSFHALPANFSRSSDHLVLGLPCLRPTPQVGFHDSVRVDHLPSVFLANSPAARHFNLRYSTTQSRMEWATAKSSTVPADRFMYSIQDSSRKRWIRNTYLSILRRCVRNVRSMLFVSAHAQQPYKSVGLTTASNSLALSCKR